MTRSRNRTISQPDLTKVPLLFWGLTLLASVLFMACAQVSTDGDESIVSGEAGHRLDQHLTPRILEAMESNEIPGLSIGVVFENQIVYAKGFGYEHILTKSPVTPTSNFHMASISKTFVATAIMKLVEGGKMDLDEKVVTYLPYFKMGDDSYQEITIRQMLGHISGMPNSNDYEWDKPQYDEGAIERYVRSLASEKMELKPGEKFRYSNIAFEVLGDVIAKVSGQSFCDYQQSHVLESAGMSRSSFLKPAELPENWAAPHEMSLKPFVVDHYPYNRRHAPSSTLHSNAIDMCHWALVNLNMGSFDRFHLLNRSSYDELWNPWVNIDEGYVAKYGNMGLSWFIGEYEDDKAVSHGGSDDGFQTYCILLPERALGVIVMANILPAPVEEIAYMAIDLVKGKDVGPVIPLASIPAWKILEERGLEAAILFYKDLELNNPDDYDFGISQFFNLYFSVAANKDRDATRIAEFCKAILPDEDLEYLTGLMEYALDQEPEKQLTIRVLDILKGQ